MEAMIFMMIFGACLLLTALILILSRDPRQSIFLARVRNLDSMSLDEAKGKAAEIARIVAIIGILLIVVCGIGAFILSGRG